MNPSDNPILLELAAVLAIATALHVALGPIVARIVEALKPSGIVPDNFAGLFAILLSGTIGGVMGLLAYLSPQSTNDGDWRYIAYGIVAGILGPGSGAVTSAQVREGIRSAKDDRDYKKSLEEDKAVNNAPMPMMASAPMMRPYDAASPWRRGTEPTYGVDEDDRVIAVKRFDFTPDGGGEGSDDHDHSHDAIMPDDETEKADDEPFDMGKWVLDGYKAEEVRLAAAERGETVDGELGDEMEDPDIGTVSRSRYFGGPPQEE